jgi:transcriptional regulator with GAF, ATPase, and Fis domain
MGRLRLFVPTAEGDRIYDLDADEAVVGRDDGAGVHLPDPHLSRRHCRFFRAEDGWQVEDLGSRNGTLLNGAPLVAPTRLSDADRLRIGRVEAAVSFPRDADEISLPPDAGPARPPTVLASDLGSLQREVRALHHLVGVLRQIAEARDEDGLLDAMLDAALELLGARRGFLLLARPDHLLVRRARGSGGIAIDDPAETLSLSLARAAVREGRVVLTDDATLDRRFGSRESVVKLGLRSVLCVPLKAGEEVLGSVYVDDDRRTAAFGAAEVSLLEAFAAQAAVALQHMRQRREAAQRRREAVRQAQRVARLNERLRRILHRRTAALKAARQELAQQADELGLKYRYDQIVGRSPAMRDVLRLVDRVTDLVLPVLVVGESGTGKELVARAIHFNGPRRRMRFIGENCGAVPESLMESEFFGYMKGAFTGATRDHAGLFEQADKGTLFLDEVGEMPVELQKKLLRVLEEGTVRRLAGKDEIPVDVRIVSATNRDLAGLRAEGRFREDLYYRLAGVVIEVPPLRERREDVEPLLAHFLAEAWPGGPPPRVEPGVLDLFSGYAWPGNVRELRNEVRRLVALCEGGVIRTEHVSERISSYRPPDPQKPAPGGLKALVEDLERRILRATLQRHGWNKSRAAIELGLSRLGLRKKVERYGLQEEQPGR